tara:strand:- start:12775 stop:13632 length:858 start_codon:yes stop_codon:yes gene_type:complete
MSTSIQQIGFVYNPQVTEAMELCDSLIEQLQLRDCSWSSSAEKLVEKEQEFNSTSLIVVLGGDGTILRTLRVLAFYKIPMLSINLGRVGFMSELEVDSACAGIKKYMDGDSAHWIDERTMIDAAVFHENDEKYAETFALNEIVISRGQNARLLHVEAIVDSAKLTTYRADGVLVSTATGSTGYAMAAGGPIITPKSTNMVLLPIAGHMCLDTGLVLSGESKIRLNILNDAQAFISGDGFAVDQSLKPGDYVLINRSICKASFIRFMPRESFYSTLTSRLGIVDRS